jgi:hypothetical protein
MKQPVVTLCSWTVEGKVMCFGSAAASSSNRTPRFVVFWRVSAAWQRPTTHSGSHRQTGYLFTYSMELSPSSEANWFSASQESICILWNQKLYYRIRKCPPPVSILNQLDLVHTPHSTFWGSILILSSHLRLGLSSGLFPSGFPTKTPYTPLLSPYALHAPPISSFSPWSRYRI